MKSATSTTYTFPLSDEGGRALSASEPTGGAVFRTPNDPDFPGLEGTWSYLIVYGGPLLVIAAAFGIGAGASLTDNNITLHPFNVMVVWIVALVVYVVIGLLWSCTVEQRLYSYYFERWGTSARTYRDADIAMGSDYLESVERRPPRRTFWMIPLMYIIIATTDTFLVIVPAIEWPHKNYSYWIAAFRGLIKGMGTGGVTGMTLGTQVDFWPLELSWLAIIVGALQTMAASTITVAISEAWDITNPNPILQLSSQTS
jgi:uncharacterized membrane protein